MADDLEAVVDIASVVDPPADDAEVDAGYYRHLLQHGRLVVAEASDIVIGYAAVIEVGATRHVSDRIWVGMDRFLSESVAQGGVRHPIRAANASLRHDSALRANSR